MFNSLEIVAMETGINFGNKGGVDRGGGGTGDERAGSGERGGGGRGERGRGTGEEGAGWGIGVAG